MYKKILVPLDGSILAECVLPHVEAIAKGCNTEVVVLLRAVEPSSIPIGTVDTYTLNTEDVQRIDDYSRMSAENYLNGLAGKLKYGKASIHSEVIMGKAAETIADYASHNGVDLIAIATHGRSGVSRWVWGSVADKVLRSSQVPVLMVRAPGSQPGV